MKRYYWPLILLLLVMGILALYDRHPLTEEGMMTQNQEANNPIAGKADLIRVDNLELGSAISSPLTITGEARGTWFFEASFPIILTNWDGLIIAETFATAQEEWMTEEFVPFTATVEFENPVFPGADEEHFSRRGSLILQKDNPSGLPEFDDALEIPIRF